ncbi:MAG: hypothetical protein ACREUA_00305 [Burkholderiales bacterium]
MAKIPPRDRDFSGALLLGGRESPEPQGQQMMVPALPADFIVGVFVDKQLYLCAVEEWAQAGLGCSVMLNGYRRIRGRVVRFRNFWLVGHPHCMFGCKAPPWWAERDSAAVSEDASEEALNESA